MRDKKETKICLSIYFSIQYFTQLYAVRTYKGHFTAYNKDYDYF